MLLWRKRLPVSHEAAGRRRGRRLLRRGQIGARRRKVSLEHSTAWGAEPWPRLREGQREHVVHQRGGAWEIEQGLCWKPWLVAVERLPLLVWRWWWSSPLLLRRGPLRLEEITLEVLLEIHRARESLRAEAGSGLIWSGRHQRNLDR